MKKISFLAIVLSVVFLISACGTASDKSEDTSATNPTQVQLSEDMVEITLSDTEILVDGKTISTEDSSEVYVANDIVYYEEGHDFTYGEGTDEDAHSKEEAAAHTVVHISEAGQYSISGTLSKGQIAVDLGKDAKEDPSAVVTLLLNGVDITCEVAPAVIFYNVYECGSDDVNTASKDVDTSFAGANVIIADGTENVVNGSYVARIYKPESVQLSEDGSSVEDASKLHKYDGAFYSRMSMNVYGGNEGTGVLNINAENEGLDSELHLTINGGNINIRSGNDGINTNEDGVSVTTVNGGKLNIVVTGETGEGDGIDSNGWIVVNGGEVSASACSFSQDAGIDSDMGIHINGGTVVASGSMLDRIEDGGQTYAVFSFAQKQSGTDVITLKTVSLGTVAEMCMQNDYSVLIYSSPDLLEGTYNLFSGDVKLAGGSSGMMGGQGMHGMRPDGMEPPEMQEGMSRPEGFEGMTGPVAPEGMTMPENFQDMTGPVRPDGMEPPAGFDQPEGMMPPDGMEFPEGQMPNRGERPDYSGTGTGEVSSDFQIKAGANMFSGIAPEA